MRSIFFFLVGFTIPATIFAQPGNTAFLRHDTITLSANQCEWVVKSLTANDPDASTSLGRNLPQVLFYLAKQGKIVLYDAETGEPIPGKDAYTWKMPSDSLYSYDKDGNPVKLISRQRERNTNDYNQLRVYTDWLLDVATGHIIPQVKWVVLMEEVHSAATGTFLGYRPFCKIYY